MGSRKAPVDAELPLELWVQKTRLEQGLPAYIEDTDVLTKVADLLGLRIRYSVAQAPRCPESREPALRHRHPEHKYGSPLP